MSENLLEFKQSQPLSVGVELELQLVDRRTGDLTRAASDLIALVTRKPFPGDIKPEITESMLEVSTSVHTGYDAAVNCWRCATRWWSVPIIWISGGGRQRSPFPLVRPPDL
jgi:hypothetical protein